MKANRYSSADRSNVAANGKRMKDKNVPELKRVNGIAPYDKQKRYYQASPKPDKKLEVFAKVALVFLAIVLAILIIAVKKSI